MYFSQIIVSGQGMKSNFPYIIQLAVSRSPVERSESLSESQSPLTLTQRKQWSQVYRAFTLWRKNRFLWSPLLIQVISNHLKDGEFQTESGVHFMRIQLIPTPFYSCIDFWSEKLRCMHQESVSEVNRIHSLFRIESFSMKMRLKISYFFTIELKCILLWHTFFYFTPPFSSFR